LQLKCQLIILCAEDEQLAIEFILTGGASEDVVVLVGYIFGNGEVFAS
jgi:hypothetical protein